MHRRLLGWLLIGVLLAAVTVRAQTPPATPAVAGQEAIKNGGIILVAKFNGKVDIIVDGVSKQATIDMPVPAKARVVTAQGASVVLVFSNGASTQLGSDTDLVIEEYLQDPLAAVAKVAEMVDEPTRSRTKLMLNKGELVGNVKKLKYDQGSSFTVQTPVGAAGIRGTTFRIVFRPNGTGQAFFTLTTATGQVEFSQPNQNTGTQTTTTTTTTTGSGTAAVQVPQGQELVIVDVQVTTNAQGQTVVVVLPQTPTSTTGSTAANMDAVLNVAKDIAVATQNATFSPPTPSNSGQGGSGSQNPGGTSGDGGTGGIGGQGGTGGDGGAGGTTGTTTGTTTGSTTGTTTTQTGSISGSNFTGDVTKTTTTPPTTTQATRNSTISSGP